MTAGRKLRLEPGRILAAARQSAALLRALAPGRRAFSDLVDAICCPVCGTWVKPRQFVVSARSSGTAGSAGPSLTFR